MRRHVPDLGTIAELLRAPAALTVPGDSLAGASAADWPFGIATPALAASSTCLYWAGMALNDYADRDLDATERSGRPIPSGRVSPGFALGLAAGLSVTGVGIAGVAGGRRALAVAVPLAGTVWAYDLALKSTPAGPVTMAAARGLDVLLGTGVGRLRAAAPAALTVGAHTLAVAALSRGEAGHATPGAQAASARRRGAALCVRGDLRAGPAGRGTRPRPAAAAAGGRRWDPRHDAVAGVAHGGRRGAVGRRAGRGRVPAGAAARPEGVADMTTLRFGYGTNGFANHRLGDALAVIADLGYSGVALTLDHNHLDPYADDLPRQVAKLARRLDELGLAVVVETGARYLLDPWRRHAPTLVSNDGRERRVDLLVRAVRIAADLDAEAVSLWSGTKPPELPDADAWERLVAGCSQVMEAADALGVPLGFEPEPGMFIEDLDGFDRLLGLLGAPERFGITLDVGHCRCLERTSVPDCVRRAAPRLVNVQIDDMRRGVHQHLEFGTGEIDFPPVLAVLAEVSYRGLVAVELPRHSHVAPDVARRSLEFLRSASPRSGEGGRMRLDAVRTALAGRLSADGEQWLRQSVGRIEASAPAIRSLFPAAGRRCGRGPLDASPPADPETLRGWTVDAAARVVLLGALPLAGPALAEEIAQLYRYGDAAEKLAVLRGLALLDASHGLGEAGLPIVWDALRTNDTRLVAAALGPYGAKHLDASAYRQGVLKCVFMGIPLADISGLDRRSDDELARMLQAFAEERIAAGRPVPADVWLIVPRTPDLEPTED